MHRRQTRRLAAQACPPAVAVLAGLFSALAVWASGSQRLAPADLGPLGLLGSSKVGLPIDATNGWQETHLRNKV